MREEICLKDCYLDGAARTYHGFREDENGERKDLEFPLISMGTGRKKLPVRGISVVGYKVHVQVDSDFMKSIREARVLAVDGRKQILHVLEIHMDEKEFQVNVQVLRQEAQAGDYKEFALLLECIQDKGYELYSLYEESKVEGNSALKRHEQRAVTAKICEEEIRLPDCSEEYLAAVFAGEDGLLEGLVCSREYYIRKVQVCKVKALHMSGSRLRLKLQVDPGGYELGRVVLEYRTTLTSQRNKIPFQQRSCHKKGNFYELDVELDLSQEKFLSIYWDVRVEFMDSAKGAVYGVGAAIYRREKITSKYYYGSYEMENGYFFYPCSTATGRLAFQYRERRDCDKWSFVLKEAIAYVLFRTFRSYWKKRQIWLVYEKFCIMAQDNGYYFFKYCMENQEEERLGKEIYYILTKDSPDRGKMRQYGRHVVDYLSIRHMIYLQAAQVLISTDAKTHVYAFRCRMTLLKQFLKRLKLVFLQHGVTALKKVGFFYGKGRAGGCDLFVVTSDFEKRIVEENFGYTEQEIANTGFARWDVLEDKSQDSREILVMPTWRNWLDEVPDEEFVQSDYFLHYTKLLNSRKLQELLETYDLKLNFYLHSKFREFIQDFRTDSGRIRLIPFGEEPVNEMLMKCRMLITDYSSVCWDVFYLNKPVVFYQFDLDQYEEAHGSYLDMRRDLFGPRVEELDRLLEEVEKCAADGFRLKPEYAAMRGEYYKYIDDQNSRRICEAIESQLLCRK